jgi:predicted ATPase/DNA-binding winged helix-turn-helix (wHTH) protein
LSRTVASIEFGRFKVVPHRRELLADGEAVELTGRLFDLLMALINARGTVVSKDHLMRQVWPGRIVEENSLQVAIAALRGALGVDRDLIRTVARRGYQFVGDIREHALPNSSSHPTNLPAPISPLVGRESVLSEVRGLVLEHRLTTLTGAGGIGKTRLAIEVARGLIPNFADGVWIIDLASLTNPELVPTNVGVALGLSAFDMAPVRISSLLGKRHMLVVLDSCEHVIGAAARMAAQLVAAGAGIFALATSREPLHSEGEWIYQVQPLDTPPDNAREPEDILATGAAQLFITRARAAQPLFQPSPNEVARLGDICRRLDGMPLAIEFAAARAAVLGIEEVALGLHQRFRLLTGGHRTALPRHQTLRATLDWSYELLAESDRQALCRVAVFASEFTLEAARAVLSDAAVGGCDVRERVAALVDKSLLAVRLHGGIAHYRMLETTRAYALERLAERGELVEFTKRHAQCHLAIFERATSEWRARPLTEWSDDYCHLIDDGRAALDWAFSAGGDAAMGAALTVALVPVWNQLSLLEELTKRAEQALRAISSLPQSDARCEMQLNATLGTKLLHTRGIDAPEGIAALNRTLEIAERLHDIEHQLVALHGLWQRYNARGNCRPGLSFARRFCHAAEISGEAVVLGWGDVMMGRTHLHMGHPKEARGYIEAAMARVFPASHRRFLLDDYEQKLVDAVRAQALWFQGLPDHAVQVATQCVDDAIALDHTISLFFVLGLEAFPVALLVGSLETAQRYIRMLRDQPKIGFWYENWVCGLQAAVEIKRGNVDPAVGALQRALCEVKKTGRCIYEVWLTVILAEGLARDGHVDEALSITNEAIAESMANEACWYLPEQFRVKGELVLLKDVRNAQEEAELCFGQALEHARRQRALSWELRAASSLCRLREHQGRTADALTVLQPVYARFTEGFDTADLVTARAILGALQSDTGTASQQIIAAQIGRGPEQVFD